MTTPELAAAVLSSQRLREAVSVAAHQSVVRDFGHTLVTEAALPSVAWGEALTLASCLTSIDAEAAQEAVLRVAQGCLASSDAHAHHREAAAILLERLGNRRGLRLAASRKYVSEDAWTSAPSPAQLDVIRRRLELSIPLSDGGAIEGNQFQRNFWSAAQGSDWVSVSAPTSAGKSFIVKRWFQELIASRPRFRGVYLVPTRALIEEVGASLRHEFSTEVGILSLPWDSEVGKADHEIHVLTQERLHLLQQMHPSLDLDLLFIDEAQKFGDGRRGVLLQQVLLEATRRNPDAQVLFASPLSSNPEMLLEGASPQSRAPIAIQSETLTVNQNLLWANQVRNKPMRWKLELIDEGEPQLVGEFDLPARASPDSKRLPYVAVALGDVSGGNVIYVNGAAAAETAARQIYELLGSEAECADHDEIVALRDLVQKTIHRGYELATVLTRGVAFHYGNMPLLVRNEVERLFRTGAVRYLVCTSTLLEGVNLPCQNLFVLNPMKGNDTPMTPSDFWNLAGRAGRWGMEFQGNIVCVDTAKPNRWKSEIPRRRERRPLVRATDRVLAAPEPLIEYITAGAPLDEAKATPMLEALFSFLSTRVIAGSDLTDLPNLTGPDAAALAGAVHAQLATCEVPEQLLSRHSGISPPAQQRLLSYFRTAADPASLVLPPPESDNAVDTYAQALLVCNGYLAPGFDHGKWRTRISILLVSWMKGLPLAYIIEQRLAYLRRRGLKADLPVEIRNTMRDIETAVRFQAPKYLACYADILAHHFRETGADQTAISMHGADIGMMLELGVSSRTAMSLMALGLSRTSAIALFEFIADDTLSRDACLAWIRDQNLEGLTLPALVRAEIERVTAHSPSSS